jgi:hypothetical protein
MHALMLAFSLENITHLRLDNERRRATAVGVIILAVRVSPERIESILLDVARKSSLPLLVTSL